ncbi:MAG: N-acetylmuramoyl-L-alanine amidase [Bacteroidia bacterium]
MSCVPKILKHVGLALLLGLAITQNGTAQQIEKRLLPNYCSSPASGDFSMVMLHYISNALEKPENPYVLDDILGIFTKYKLSAHYLINREGQIYQLVSHQRKAFHAGKGRLPQPPHHENNMNSHAIGIELMGTGTKEEMVLLGIKHYDRIALQDRGFTDAQYKSLLWLLQKLENELPAFSISKQGIVGHDEYAPNRRGDPGMLFDWNKIGLNKAQ